MGVGGCRGSGDESGRVRGSDGSGRVRGSGGSGVKC